MAEYLRRFRAGLEELPRLGGGAPNREALARWVLEALGRRDTAALAGLLLTREEFGWLVFPYHRYARPPYELDPALFWFQLQAGNSQGLARTLGRFGGQRLEFRGLTCEADTLQFRAEGAVRGWTSCQVRMGAGGKILTRPLFGTIVERDGRVKLLSYATPDWNAGDTSATAIASPRPAAPPPRTRPG